MSFFNPPQVLCRYCELKKVRTFAVRNRRGFDLCQKCYDSQAKAERESDEFNEQFYKNQAIIMKENARFEDMIADKRRVQLMKDAMEADVGRLDYLDNCSVDTLAEVFDYMADGKSARESIDIMKKIYE